MQNNKITPLHPLQSKTVEAAAKIQWPEAYPLPEVRMSEAIDSFSSR